MGQRFEVLNGSHVEPVRKVGASLGGAELTVYRPDTNPIVDSDRPLDEIFPNKFKKVGDNDPLKGKDLESRQQHVEELIRSGSFSNDDREFLSTLSPKQFQHVLSKLTATTVTKVHAVAKPHADAEAHVVVKEKRSVLGEDVTASFPDAAAVGVRVYKGPFGKVQVSKDGKTCINQKPLKIDEVPSFIATMGK